MGYHILLHCTAQIKPEYIPFIDMDYFLMEDVIFDEETAEVKENEKIPLEFRDLNRLWRSIQCDGSFQHFEMNQNVWSFRISNRPYDYCGNLEDAYLKLMTHIVAPISTVIMDCIIEHDDYGDARHRYTDQQIRDYMNQARRSAMEQEEKEKLNKEKKEKGMEDPLPSTMFLSVKGHFDADPMQYVLLQFDGAADPNPGRGSAGAVLLDRGDREIIGEAGEYIDHATNNQAEYRGLQLGLRKAIEYGIKNLMIEGDSNLIIQQVAGVWKVNHPALKQEYDAVKGLLSQFDAVAIRHVPREQNQKADSITKQVLATQTGYEVKNRKQRREEEKQPPRQEPPKDKRTIEDLDRDIQEIKADLKEILSLLHSLI